MKFRKKPIIVEAEQFIEGKHKPKGVVEVAIDPRTETIVFKRSRRALEVGFGIRTLEGWSIVSNKDWIVTGINGERYPVKDDIFKKTYQEVLLGFAFSVLRKLRIIIRQTSMYVRILSVLHLAYCNWGKSLIIWIYANRKVENNTWIQREISRK